MQLNSSIKALYKNKNPEIIRGFSLKKLRSLNMRFNLFYKICFGLCPY
jgi:hypothetical protein